MADGPTTSPSIKPLLSTDVADAVSATRRGGLVAFPTETVYGLGVAATSDSGYAALVDVRKAGPEPRFALHVANLEQAERYVDLSHPVVRRFVHKIFPGPVTLEVEVPPESQAIYVAKNGLSKAVGDRIYQGNSIRLRCPEHALTQSWLHDVGLPVLASSASRPGESPSLVAQDATRLASLIDVILDGGQTRYGKPSTQVSLKFTPKGPQFKVERVGVIDERYIQKMLRLTVLMVCSGNTCRSPMADGLMRKMLADRLGIPVKDLDASGYRVLSGGTYAGVGSPAAAEAIAVMKAEGIDITRHRSRPVSTEMLHESDIIYCMTRSHRAAILRMMPSVSEKVFLLTHEDIDDPIGGPLAQYQRTAEQIRAGLAERVGEILP